MRPRAHAQAQVEDRVLQRRTTLRDEEPDKRRLEMENETSHAAWSSCGVVEVIGEVGEGGVSS